MSGQRAPISQIALMLYCPTCGAVAHQRCIRESGVNSGTLHAPRLRQVSDVLDEYMSKTLLDIADAVEDISYDRKGHAAITDSPRYAFRRAVARCARLIRREEEYEQAG